MTLAKRVLRLEAKPRYNALTAKRAAAKAAEATARRVDRLLKGG